MLIVSVFSLNLEGIRGHLGILFFFKQGLVQPELSFNSYVTKDNLKFLILLPQPPRCRTAGCARAHSA